MAETNSTLSSQAPPAANATIHAKAATQEGDHSILIGWMAVLALLEQNVIATYGLENSESGLLTNISQMTEARNKQMYSDMSTCEQYMVQLIEGNAPGGDKYVPAQQECYSNIQIAGQNDTAPMTREADQWTSTLQNNSSSTDSDYQNAQALMSIAQAAAQRA